MSDPEGAGLGIVLRMALNSAGEIGADPDHSQQAQRVIQQVGDQLGIAIPDTLPDPESTAIYRSLNDEMHLARSTSEGSYAIVGLHIQAGAEQPGFHTKRQPDSFTDMITTACVMAQLDLLKRAASLFDWSLDVTRVDELIAKATAMNNAAAQGEAAAHKLKAESNKRTGFCCRTTSEGLGCLPSPPRNPDDRASRNYRYRPKRQQNRLCCAI